MSVEEILRQVRRIEIKSKWLANHVFAGGYRSAFKGTGLRFKEVREYVPGDDIRFIDWNVTARMGHYFTKLFEEERELSIYLLVDISPSTLFGTSQGKREMITRICADLCYSSILNNDRIGLILFSDKTDKYLPPGKNPDHTEYLIKAIFSANASSSKTDLVKPINFLNNITRHKSIVFILSDFAFDGYENALSILSRKHDVIGLRVYDKVDQELPDAGWLHVKDIETGSTMLLNTRDKSIRWQYTAQFQTFSTYAAAAFKKAGAELLSLETGKNYITELQKLFLQRVR